MFSLWSIGGVWSSQFEKQYKIIQNEYYNIINIQFWIIYQSHWDWKYKNLVKIHIYEFPEAALLTVPEALFLWLVRVVPNTWNAKSVGLECVWESFNFHIGCALTWARLKPTVLAIQQFYINHMTLTILTFYWATTRQWPGLTWQNKRVPSYFNGASKTSTPERINKLGQR